MKVFLLMVALAVAVAGGITVYMMYDEVGRIERMNTFYPGVYVDGVPLYGATPQEAYDYLTAQSRGQIANWAINLSYGENTWRIDADTLGMNASIEEAVQNEVSKAYYIGREGSMIDRYRTILSLKQEPYMGYSAGAEKSMDKIDMLISEIQEAVYRAPVDATRSFDPNRSRPVVVTDDQAGQELDAVALKAQITQYINTMEPANIQIQPTPINAARRAGALSQEVMLIGRGSTKISSRSTEDRTRNVERGLQAFHGKVVQPGERVSFNKWVGKRTQENGFFQAEEIVRGTYEMGWGGGICQVSSTLYAAVIEANLKVRERHNHGIPVNYMEMGEDATVTDDGRKDFVFENNTDAPIYLVAKLVVDGRDKYCTVEIYGRPEPNGYTYGLRHEIVEEIPIPKPTYIPDRDGQYVKYTDQEEEVFKGAVGNKVRTFLVVRDSSGALVREDQALYTDTYSAQAPRIYVGTSKREDW